VAPRREQLIRAERLRDVGLLDVLHPDAVSPAAVARWLAADAPAPDRGRIDLNGLRHLPGLVSDLLADAPLLPPIPAARAEVRHAAP
jgi:predicted glycosyltransferase